MFLSSLKITKKGFYLNFFLLFIPIKINHFFLYGQKNGLKIDFKGAKIKNYICVLTFYIQIVLRHLKWGAAFYTETLFYFIFIYIIFGVFCVINNP